MRNLSAQPHYTPLEIVGEIRGISEGKNKETSTQTQRFLASLHRDIEEAVLEAMKRGQP